MVETQIRMHVHLVHHRRIPKSVAENVCDTWQSLIAVLLATALVSEAAHPPKSSSQQEVRAF